MESKSFTANVHGRDLRKVRAEQKVNRRIVISLIIGGLVLIGVFLPYLLYGPHNLAVLYMAYYHLYIPLQVLGAITCIIIFILNLTASATYHLKLLKTILLSLLGAILAFSPFIYSGTMRLIALNSPHVATAGTSTSYSCPSSATRSENPYLLGTEEPSGSMNHLNAWDGVCAYLEAYYRNGQLPQSQSDLIPYIQSYATKNGTAHITINGQQPRDTNTANIITERSCSYSAGKDLSAISVWYLDPKQNNELRCETIKADNNLNLYDLQSSRTWYSKQFDQTPRH